MPDSPRYCDVCKSYGDHHTDRCPTTWGRLSVQEQSDLAMSEEIARQRKAAARRVKKAPQPAKQSFTTNQLIAFTFAMSAFTFLLGGNVALAISMAVVAYMFYNA